MLKRLFVFLVVLAIAVGGLWIWWQLNARRVLTEQVQRISKSFVTNPENLKVEIPEPVTMVGRNRAKVPELVITGQNLLMDGGHFPGKL